MAIGDIIKKVIDKFAPGVEEVNNNEIPSGKEPLTIPQLANNIVDFFEERMNNMSKPVRGNCRILYPMSFNILLHPDDYDNVSEGLKFELPAILGGFYDAIKNKTEQLKTMGLHFTYTPPATYWFFQWAACSQHEGDGNQSVPVQKGEAHIISSLTTFDITNSSDVSSFSNVKQTGRVINSNTESKNINMMALLKSDLILPNADKYNFDESLPTDINIIMGEQRNGNNALATLYAENKRFNMMDDLITISGASETRSASSNLIIINNANIIKSHVQIKYDKDSKLFKICAYAPVVVDERPLTISVGGQPVWEQLSLKSDIFFPDALLTVKFEAVRRG